MYEKLMKIKDSIPLPAEVRHFPISSILGGIVRFHNMVAKLLNNRNMSGVFENTSSIIENLPPQTLPTLIDNAVQVRSLFATNWRNHNGYHNFLSSIVARKLTRVLGVSKCKRGKRS
jgi:hypothetical protein